MVPVLIGYASVLTLEQNIDFQTGALNRAGCEKLFTHKAGGAGTARPGLDQTFTSPRAGRMRGSDGNQDAISIVNA